MPKIYDQFATVYDRMGADRHSLRMCEYTLEIFKKFKIHPKTGLEICCGTGSALEFFADRGIEMCGVDQSAKMLAEARRKVGRKVLLTRTVLPNLAIANRQTKRLHQFDFAYSFYDSLNYLLKPQDLAKAFSRVHAHLVAGGFFIFDMNTPAALQNIWGNNVWGGAHDDLCWLFRNTFDKANTLGTVRTTFFERHGKLWRRFDEVHIERAYSNAVIKKLMVSAGFSVKAIYKCNTFERATDKSNRICVVAKKG